jgi:hypothetical protein
VKCFALPICIWSRIDSLLYDAEFFTWSHIFENRGYIPEQVFFAFENHGYESKNHPDNRQGSIAVSDNRPTMGHFLFELLLLGKEWPVLLQSLFSCK